MKYRLADNRVYIVKKHVRKDTRHSLASLKCTIKEQVKVNEPIYRREEKNMKKICSMLVRRFKAVWRSKNMLERGLDNWLDAGH